MKEITLSDPQEDFITSTEERNLFLAGVGSGKSHVLGLLSADFVKNFPHVIGFIGANTREQLAKSTLSRIFKVWAEVFGWKRGIDYVVNITPPKHWIKFGEQMERYDNTICFANGAIIYTSSLENYTAIDGTEFGWALLDETKDTREEAVKEVIVARLRQSGMYINPEGELIGFPKEGFTSWNPLYIVTSPAKVDWINEWFEIGDQDELDEIQRRIFSETDFYSRTNEGKAVVISSTYHNAHNLPKNYIANIIKDNAGNQNRINMLIYGSPVAKTGGEYVPSFMRMEHVKPIEYLPDVPIHVSFDFNRVPYLSVLPFQVVRNGGVYEARFFDEMPMEPPRNITESACREFGEKYLTKNKAGFFYTGDASGKSMTVRSIEHDYQTLERVLRRHISSSSDRTLRRNPLLGPSRDFVNKCLANGFDHIRVVISPRCKRLIADLEFLKEGPDGGYIKQNVKDKTTGQTYEKYGHFYDALKYALIATFESTYDQ